jgi:hypothetical protein
MARSLAPGGVEQTVVRLFGLLVCLAVVVPAQPRLGLVAGVVALLLAAGTAWLVWRWVPEAISGARQRRPVVAGLWALAALLALAQIGRLSAFMTEPDRVWGSVVPDPLVASHACLSATSSPPISPAADAQPVRRALLPGLRGRCAKLLAPGDVRNLGLDRGPLQYPPPFLLFPRAALFPHRRLPRHSCRMVRAQALGLLVVAAWLARWIGGRDGQLALLLLPVLLASLPTMLGLQFGQFHVATLMLSIAAMIFFEGDVRRSVGSSPWRSSPSSFPPSSWSTCSPGGAGGRWRGPSGPARSSRWWPSRSSVGALRGVPELPAAADPGREAFSFYEDKAGGVADPASPGS